MALAAKSSRQNPLSKMILNTSQGDGQAAQDAPVVRALKQIEDRVVKATQYRDKHAENDLELSSESSTLSEQSSGTADNIVVENTSCERCLLLRKQDRGFVGPLSKNELTRHQFCELCRDNRSNHNDDTQLGADSKHNTQRDLEVNACAQSLEKKIVLSSSVSIPEDAILSHRLSVEQIRELPRFTEYEPGELNKVFVIMNLLLTLR